MKPNRLRQNIFVNLYNKKVLRNGEQDVVCVNLVWVIVKVSLMIIRVIRYLKNPLIDCRVELLNFDEF